MGKHLIVGAAGQLGIELMLALQDKVGPEQVVLADIRSIPHPSAAKSEFVQVDATDGDALKHVVERHDATTMYMLVAMLSAKGEVAPMEAWALNMQPLLHALELAKGGQIQRLFWPSSIAVFGPDAPKHMTPQTTALNPTTVYGVSKVAGELWCKYYNEQYGVDVRSLRYPGLIGFRSQPGGGTTDYAVEAFHCAAQNEGLTCYLDARLPMMSMRTPCRHGHHGGAIRIHQHSDVVQPSWVRFLPGRTGRSLETRLPLAMAYADHVKPSRPIGPTASTTGRLATTGVGARNTTWRLGRSHDERHSATNHRCINLQAASLGLSLGFSLQSELERSHGRLAHQQQLTCKKEKFEPINPPCVGLYVWPTVYSSVHLGNVRASRLTRLPLPAAPRLQSQVRANITDVGHLTGDTDDGKTKSARRPGWKTSSP